MTQRMVWGGRREEGSGWGTHVYLWRIHFDIWQNQYNIVKLKKKRRSLWNLPDGRDWLRGKLGLMGWAMVSYTLMQFSVDGQGCVPSLLFDLRPHCGGGSEDNGSLLQKVPCTHCCTECPNPAPGHHRPMSLPETPRRSRASVGQSLMGSLLLSPGPGVHKSLFVPSKSLFP